MCGILRALNRHHQLATGRKMDCSKCQYLVACLSVFNVALECIYSHMVLTWPVYLPGTALTEKRICKYRIGWGGHVSQI